MPELPEVETVARNIANHILNKKIIEANVYWPRTIAEPADGSFCARITGQTVLQVSRRAKYIQIQLSVDTLMIHLRMSGDLLFSPSMPAPAKHDRVVLSFAGGSSLAFNDPRKFGRIWLVTNPNEVTVGLGPEPLADQFTVQKLSDILASSQRNIKAMLLDQTKIAGLGNIYTDEALYLAGILPTRNSSSLDHIETEKLYNAIKHVLQEGIRNNGASFDWVYRGGHFQNHFNVYKRQNLPCNKCGTPISKTVVHQRGTHYCHVCQK